VNVTPLSRTETIRVWLRLDAADPRPIPNHPDGAHYSPRLLNINYVRQDGRGWECQPANVFGDHLDKPGGAGRGHLFESFTGIPEPTWVTDAVEANHPALR